MTATSGTDLQQAVVRVFAQHLGHDVNPDDVDCDARFFEQSGFYLGEYVLDSLSLIEIIVTLESKLNVEILGSGDVQRWDSVVKLSEFILAVAESPRLTAFSAACSQPAQPGCRCPDR
jgi:acyl carrier protein